MLDFIYQMTCKLLKIAFLRENVKILPFFSRTDKGCHYVTLPNL